jgi:hypothetical protein
MYPITDEAEGNLILLHQLKPKEEQ